MLKRIASTGANLAVLGVSVGIFLITFIALNALGAAQKPPTVSVLSATHDLDIGDVIRPDDLAVKTVFQSDKPTANHSLSVHLIWLPRSGWVA